MDKKSTRTPSTRIDQLPNEILIMIFMNIRSHYLGLFVAKVCRRWNWLISHFVLRIQYSGDENNIHGQLKTLLVASSVTGFPDSSSIVTRVSTMIPYLKELTLCVQYSLNKQELKIIEKLKCLRHLDVFMESDVVDKSTRIPQGITSLVINNNIFPGFLRTLRKRHETLKAFHLYGKCYIYRSREMAGFLNHYSTQLTELTLRCSDSTSKMYEIVGNCKALVSLQLYACLQLTFIGATHLTGLKRLRRLHLTGLKMVRIRPMCHLIERLPPRIEELNLSNSVFGEEHCSLLVGRLPELRSLELWGCRITTQALLRMTAYLPALQELDTDVHFTLANLGTLNDHESLKNVRCRFTGEGKWRIHLKSAMDVIPVRYLREHDQEGPSSELFYYWTQGITINPPPVSAFFNDDQPT